MNETSTTTQTIGERLSQKLDALRPVPAPEPDERTRVITCRMPKWLHERLRRESRALGVSMNALCVATLDAACEQLMGERGELPEVRSEGQDALRDATNTEHAA